MANETSLTNRAVAVCGTHHFTVEGHSQIRGIETSVSSMAFRIGGHDWRIEYFPNGNGTDEQHTAIFLHLENAGEDVVTASFSFCLMDPESPATGEKLKSSFAANFSSSEPCLGNTKFMSKTDLAASGCLKDDRLVIKCTVDIIDGALDQDTIVVVPPSDMNQDFGHLWESGLKTDMTIKMSSSSETFNVHRSVLITRSPVFSAQLCGSMMESKQSVIYIEDMSATVLEVLLHFIYNDSLPPGFMEEATDEEATSMAQHLLVAADRYGMVRLKLICESKLSKSLDINTVGYTLDFAEQHYCHQLKACCVKYMLKNRERFRAICNTQGFRQLKENYPLTACEITDKFGDGL